MNAFLKGDDGLDYTTILECLEQKRILFVQYEQHTGEMRTCEIDDLEGHIAERERLAKEIDKITRDIESFSDMMENPDEIRDAVANRGDYSDFSAEMRHVYDQASKIYTAINHIHNMESEIMQRMKDERALCLENIKKGSDTAKMYGYVKNLQVHSHQNMLLGDQKV